MVLGETLKEAGYEVLGPTGSASKALALAEQRCPDIALVDIFLHGRPTGIDVAHEISGSQDTPVIFLSANRDEALAHRESAVAFLSKPFTPEEVLATLEVVKCIVGGGDPPPPQIPHRLELFAT